MPTVDNPPPPIERPPADLQPTPGPGREIVWGVLSLVAFVAFGLFLIVPIISNHGPWLRWAPGPCFFAAAVICAYAFAKASRTRLESIPAPQLFGKTKSAGYALSVAEAVFFGLSAFFLHFGLAADNPCRWWWLGLFAGLTMCAISAILVRTFRRGPGKGGVFPARKPGSPLRERHPGFISIRVFLIILALVGTAATSIPTATYNVLTEITACYSGNPQSLLPIDCFSKSDKLEAAARWLLPMLAAILAICWGYIELSVHHHTRSIPDDIPEVPPETLQHLRRLAQESVAVAPVTSAGAEFFILMIAGADGERIARIQEDIELDFSCLRAKRTLTYLVQPSEQSQHLLVPAWAFKKGTPIDRIVHSGGSSPVTAIPIQTARARVLAIIEHHLSQGDPAQLRRLQRDEGFEIALLRCIAATRPEDEHFGHFETMLVPYCRNVGRLVVSQVTETVRRLSHDNFHYFERHPTVSSGATCYPRHETIEIDRQSVRQTPENGIPGGRFDRIRRGIENLTGVTRPEIHVGLGAVVDSPTVHYFVRGPAGTYLLSHGLIVNRKKNGPIDHETVGSNGIVYKDPRLRIEDRRRLAQNYGRLYLRYAQEFRDSDFYFQFAEVPPGAAGRVGVVAVLQGIILAGVSLAAINDAGSITPWSSLLFALPALTHVLRSVRGRAQRPHFALVPRVISAFLVVTALAAATVAVSGRELPWAWQAIGAFSVVLGIGAAISWIVRARIYYRFWSRGDI
jgi:hypothetical protein